MTFLPSFLLLTLALSLSLSFPSHLHSFDPFSLHSLSPSYLSSSQSHLLSLTAPSSLHSYETFTSTLSPSALHMEREDIPSTHATHPKRSHWIALTDMSNDDKVLSQSIDRTNTRVSLSIALRQSNSTLLPALLREVSDPSSPQYGQWYSQSELNDVIRPSDETLRNTFLYFHVHQNIPISHFYYDAQRTPDFLFIHNIPLDMVNGAFHTDLKPYVNRHNGEVIYRDVDGYSLPKYLWDSHVDYVSDLSILHPSSMTVHAPSSNSHYHSALNHYVAMKKAEVPATYNVTPAFLHSIYNIPQNYASGGQGSQAVVEFLGQNYNQTDLSNFFTLFDVPVQKVVAEIGDPNDPSNAGGEAQLDIELIFALGINVPTEYWNFAGLRNNSQGPSNNNQEPFLTWMLTIANTTNPPVVFSISYDDDESSIPVSYMSRLNNEFIKAGMRGISLLFAAGDDGIGGETVRGGNTTCATSQPAFPSSSPFVTAVGGTQLDSTLTTEIVSSSATGSRITTGGGFSLLFLSPDYQISQVRTYLSTASSSPIFPPSGTFNPKGRAYPDWSSLATNYQIVLKGKTIHIGGTSASTPVNAGIVALLNDIRIRKGAAPLGFLNYWLYNLLVSPYPSFNDILVGDNSCSALPQYCCKYGFVATQGWDAVTGIGTPNWPGLVASMRLGEEEGEGDILIK